MTDKTQPTAAPGKYWARLCALPKFSFILSAAGGVARAQDSCGNWVEASAVQQIVDDAESRIAELEALQAAPPAPAAVAVPDERAKFEAWAKPRWPHPADWEQAIAQPKGVVNNYILHGEWLGWQARAALAAAPAQAWPSECDSPELCQVHRGCAGQYGTKNTCPSFAALNPCNSAAPAQAVAEQWIDDPHDIEQGMMLNPEWVRAQEYAAAAQAAPSHTEAPIDEPVTKQMIDAGAKAAREYMARTGGNNLTVIYRAMRAVAPAGGVSASPAQEHATQLAGQGQADCLVLDGDWRRRMLDGSAITRDEMGCGEHPALPVLEEGMKPKQFFDALGIELEGVMAEDQMEMDAYDAMVEATNYNVWTPEAPAGDGWVLVAIFDTDDGPAAWWMREAAPEQPASRSRKALPAQAQEDARNADGWYLQDTRSYVGNDVLWWAKNSNGYTTDVSKAHVFTQEEAFKQAAMRGVDRAWPKEYIDGKTRPAVDMQYIKHEEAIAARAAQSGATP